MKYICTNCNFIYDEFLGIPDEWIPENTSFSELTEGFSCPFCFWEKDDFYQIQTEVLYFEDKDNLTSLEYSHYPFYEVIDWNLIITFEEKYLENWDTLKKLVLLDEYEDIVYEEIMKDDLSFKYDVSDLDFIEIRVECTKHWFFSTWLISLD